ncbi:MAG: hypothetical protein ACR2LT_06055 [Pyrinomonadaceae bacterium]
MLVVAAVAAAGLLATASSASAALTALTVGGTASYEANGAGVLVPVTVTCARGAQIEFGYLSLTQRLPNSSLVNHANGQAASPPCSGSPQRIYAVFSSDTGAPLHVGSAVVQVEVYTCSPTSCFDDHQSLSRVVQVAKVDFPSESMHAPRLDVTLSTSATIVAAGAGMRVSGTVRCTSSSRGDVSAIAWQLSVDGVQAGGTGQLSVACDGQYHPVSLVVAAGSRVWHKGQALVALTLGVCFPASGICGVVIGVDTVTVS